jgi:PHP family Zn ribbon phosphoesterase
MEAKAQDRYYRLIIVLLIAFVIFVIGIFGRMDVGRYQTTTIDGCSGLIFITDTKTGAVKCFHCDEDQKYGVSYSILPNAPGH